MIDFAAARQFMVQGQVRINDVTDPRLTSTMLEVPRERFVPAPITDLAYLDCDLPLTDACAGPQRFLLKPLTVARLIQAAEVRSTDRILDVGCTTGYAAALLGKLAGSVVALEEHSGLARDAERRLADFGLVNVTVVVGPLSDGWPARAPYDVILIEGRCERIAQPLLSQLGHGGRLVCVQGRSAGAKGMVYRCVHGEVSGWPLFEATAPLLPSFAEPPTFTF